MSLLAQSMLYEHVSASVAYNVTADTTAESKSAVLDVAGYDGVLFAIKLGGVDTAAVLTFTVKENTANSDSSPTPTAVTLTSASAGVINGGALVLTESGGNLNNKIVLIDVPKKYLTKRYVFLSITATVESYEIDAGVALRYRSSNLPATQSSGVAAIGS